MLDMAASKVKNIVFSAAYFCKEELALERERERERETETERKNVGMKGGESFVK